jgi:AraC-like DNA-binding protein
MNEAVSVQYRVPSFDLAPFVHSYWLVESVNYNIEQPQKNILPIGRPFIIFTLQGRGGSNELTYHESNKVQNHVTGQITQSWTLTYSQKYSFLAVIFQPDGLYHLLEYNANSFTQTIFGIENLLQKSLGSISEQINQAVDFTEKIKIVEICLREELSGKLSGSDKVRDVLGLIQSNPTVSIDHICQYFKISARHLRREFKMRVGIGPKLYLRIRRFQYAVAAYQQQKDISLQDLAFQCGYFDLSHFSNDFYTFAGLNPYSYLKKSQPQNDLGSMVIRDELR